MEENTCSCQGSEVKTIIPIRRHKRVAKGFNHQPKQLNDVSYPDLEILHSNYELSYTKLAMCSSVSRVLGSVSWRAPLKLSPALKPLLMTVFVPFILSICRKRLNLNPPVGSHFECTNGVGQSAQLASA